MTLNVDFHAHILPRCDHGSDGIETSLKQISSAVSSGVGIMCATPHYYPEKEDVDQFLKRRDESLKKLKEALGADPPSIRCGAEVLCFDGIDRLPGLEKLCLEGTDILLLEMPFKEWPDGLMRSVEDLSSNKSITTVLAHADRYPVHEVEELLRFGLSVQLNTDGCCGLFLNKIYREWIDSGIVVAWGSDIHGCENGYESWIKCRKRRGDLWDTVMERTNELLGI